MAIWPLDYIFNFNTATLGDISFRNDVRGTVIVNDVVNAVKKGLFDRLQEGVFWLYTGARSVKQMLVDGTGGADTSTASPALAAGEMRALKLRATTNGLTVDAGGVQVTAGGISVNDGLAVVAGGISVGGNSAITGTLGVSSNITGGDISATTGNISAPAGAVSAGTSVAAGTTVSAGTSVSAGTTLSAGVLRASSTVGSGQGVPIGTIYGDGAPIAWAIVSSGGTLLQGYNVNTCSKSSTGSYSISVVNGLSIGKVLSGVASRNSTSGFIVVSTGQTSIGVNTYNTSNVAADEAFTVWMYGSNN